MIKVKELRDIAGARVSVIVSDPVPTLRGPKEVEIDDDVAIEIEFGPDVRVEVVVTAEHYLRIIAAAAERARNDTQVL